MASFSIDAWLSPRVSIALVFRCLIINKSLSILIDVLMLLRYSVFKVLSADARHPLLAASAAIKVHKICGLSSLLKNMLFMIMRAAPPLRGSRIAYNNSAIGSLRAPSCLIIVKLPNVQV